MPSHGKTSALPSGLSNHTVLTALQTLNLAPLVTVSASKNSPNDFSQLLSSCPYRSNYRDIRFRGRYACASLS